MSCLICVIGIPASGKSQFCSQLSSLLKTEFSDLSVLTASYDALISVEEAELLISSSVDDTNSSSVWKNRRRLIVKAVNSLLHEFLNKNTKTTNTDEREVEEIKTNILAFNQIESCASLNKNLILIIDDNLYYRSMRYEYLQLARSNEFGFCQIFLDCDIDVALQRNKSRLHSVPEEIINAMVNKLERPLSDKCKWEKYSLTVDTSNEVTHHHLSNAIDEIKKAIEDPFRRSDESDEEMKQISRLVSNTNLIHQVDNILKKITGELIQKLNSKKFDANHFHTVNTARQSVLKDLKNGDLVLSPELVEIIESGQIHSNSEKLKEFLLQKMKKKLSKC